MRDTKSRGAATRGTACVGSHGARRLCRRRRRPAGERRQASATTRSSSACSTTSPASTRTCPARTASSRSRWRSPTTRPSTATRRSPRTSRSSPPTTRTSRTSPTPRRRRCTTGRTPTSSSTCRPRRPRSPSPTQAKAAEEALHQHRRRHDRPHRRSLQQVHLPLGVRHAHARQRHRHGRSPRTAARTGSIVYPDYAFGQDMNKSFTAAVKEAGGTVQQTIADAVPERQLRHLPHQGRARPSPTSSAPCRPAATWSTSSSSSTSQAARPGHQARGRPDVHHRHPLAGRRPVRRHARSPTPGTGTSTTRTAPGPTSSRRRPTPGPSFAHAANYSAALQYLEAVQAAGTDDSDAVVKQLEGKKINDVFLRNGEVRAADHRVIHDVYLAKVKTQDQVKEHVGLRGDRQAPSPPPTPTVPCPPTARCDSDWTRLLQLGRPGARARPPPIYRREQHT